MMRNLHWLYLNWKGNKMEYTLGQMVEQRAAFGQALVELADEYPLVVLDPDVCMSTQTYKFRDKFPERFYQVGIAEQNMVGIAAGLSTQGLIPFASAFAVFLVNRSGDQIRNSVAHPKANVKLNGAYGGLPTGRAGATHSCFEDIAEMRALPNMTILEPADAVEAAFCTRLALEIDGPVYLRTVRCAVPTIFNNDHKVEIGKGIWLREGTDLTLISTGLMPSRAIDASVLLEQKGIQAGVLHMPCIKPLDTDAIAKAAQNGLIVTVENHSIIGGLGSAVCESIAESFPCRVKRIGFPDIFLESGDDEELFDRYGLSAERIAAISADQI